MGSITFHPDEDDGDDDVDANGKRMIILAEISGEIIIIIISFEI